MKAIIAAVLIIFCIPAVFATVHTTCYNYFLQKDGCVTSSASNKTRCPASAKHYSAPVRPFTLSPNHSKRAEAAQFQRRYDTTQSVFPIASGTGICGTYNSTKELGVCLWSGVEQQDPTLETAGWLNGLKTSNCGKRVYIQRKGHPETVQYARVLDGCYFGVNSTDVGCYEIGLSLRLFDKFNPSQQEKDAQRIYGGITWDFDNEDGRSPAQAPV